MIRAKARSDVLDHIECYYNQEQRKKLEQQKQEELNLTKLSVKMG